MLPTFSPKDKNSPLGNICKTYSKPPALQYPKAFLSLSKFNLKTSPIWGISATPTLNVASTIYTTLL